MNFNINILTRTCYNIDQAVLLRIEKYNQAAF